MSTKQNRVLIIQKGDERRIEEYLGNLLGEYGVIEGQDYTLLQGFDEKAVAAFVTETGGDLIVFTNHTPDCKAHDVAEVVKRIKPTALVFALTTIIPREQPGSQLDGAISKQWPARVRKSDIADIIMWFRSGVGMERIKTLISRYVNLVPLRA